MRNAYRVLVEPGRRGSLGRSRHRWEGNFKVYVKEVVSMDWLHLAQVRDSMWPVVNTVIKFRVPQKGAWSFLSSRGAVTF